MKKYLFIFLLLMLALTLSAEKDKRVYITLDVSGSMTGNKYVLANYTTQMIVTLCDDDDEVHMIVYGADECLSKKKSPLKTIQKPMKSIKWGMPFGGTSQFDDIKGFNRIYKPSDEKQDWLFIIGDGYWQTMDAQYKKDRKKFSDFVNKGTINICYLQTGANLNENSDFTQFVSGFGVIDIGKSDITPPTIKNGCDHFARKILGFSETPLQIKKNGGGGIRIRTEMPLRAFYLVYQDQQKPEDLPVIKDVTANGKTLDANLKGTPTTIPTKTTREEVTLSGHVYYINGGNIQPQTEIEVSFSKEVDIANICIYPIVEELNFGSMSLTRTGSNLKQLDSRTSSICRDEQKAIVRIELGEKSAQKLPETLLKKTKVVVKANNKDYNATFKNGTFECEIELIDDETQYYAECDCPGYFKRVTPISKIVKGDCEPEQPANIPVTEMPTSDLGTITFENLKKDHISFTIRDSLTHQVLNPEMFDVSFEIENDYLYAEPVMHIENDSVIVLEVRPKGEWCECLFPEKLQMKMVSTPKKSASEEYGKNYRQTVFPIELTVVKENPWLSRCLWVIILLIVLLLFFFYLNALLRKRRFKKTAMVTPTYYNYYGKKIEDQGGTMLRKEGFWAWFARWFLPFDERNTLYWDSPEANIGFIAADSMEVVNIPKDNIIPETMKVDGYNPKNDPNPNSPIKWSVGGKIRIKKPDGSDWGYLTFSCGEQTDGRVYRIFLVLLMTVSAIAFFILLYLLGRSFF